MLILGKEEKKLGISRKVYDLIYELNHICPTVLLAVVPQLEFKVSQPLRTAGPGAQGVEGVTGEDVGHGSASSDVCDVWLWSQVVAVRMVSVARIMLWCMV